MAEQVNDFDWEAKGKDKYPFTDWFNGETWRLHYGTDFQVPLHSFRAQLYAKARAMGVKIRTHATATSEDAIYVQATGDRDDA